MSKFDQYCNNYENIRLERHEGILQMTLHTNGGPLVLISVGPLLPPIC